MNDVKEILDLMTNASEKDIRLIKKAYSAAKKAHEGQTRFTGESYFTHVFETSKTLAELKMDAETIAAGFLHDSIEDERLTEEEVRKEFGDDILFLIKGVTKLGKLEYHGIKRHAESLRKLFIATSQDMRVLIIRLADRLHNVKTLDGHPKEEKRKRIAMETLEVFAPLAHRLGMWHLQGELEDNAFKYALPEEYKETKELLKNRTKFDEKLMEKVRRSLQTELANHGIKPIQMNYRMKRLYSLYKKILKRKNIDEIYDFIAIRVIVENVEDCYRTLGIVHKLWKLVPDTIKDYIAMPKPNGYQSLHTVVFTGDGGIVEIQIRTEQMHKEAEFGIASHLAYKEVGDSVDKSHKYKKAPAWIDQILEWQKDVSESGEFLENLKKDFFSDRVFAFTPEGDVIDLPEGSSPIDFAYAIHTDVGQHISGSKINGKMSSLSNILNNGDIVEIITNKNSHPTSKWLKYTKTTMANRRIKAYLAENDTSIFNFLPKIG
ncbi:RelA/SpoT family protein [Patescibacteria group bacterium]